MSSISTRIDPAEASSSNVKKRRTPSSPRNVPLAGV
jgi:hypothetical protein